jgi:sugar O-acyltransferase (sialic acid O-acetyltransferase NeuD family)
LNKTIILIGGGGHAAVLVELLKALDLRPAGFVDNNAEAIHLQGLPCLGSDEDVLNLDPTKCELVNGVGGSGNTGPRMAVYQRFRKRDFRFVKLVHPSAIVASDALLAEGVQVMAGAILQTGVIVAENTIINTGAIVDHHCRIGAHVHIAPGVVLSGAVTVGDGAHIGTGASIIQGRSIGAGSLVGSGSVVLTDVAPETKVFGVPAIPVARR